MVEPGTYDKGNTVMRSSHPLAHAGRGFWPGMIRLLLLACCMLSGPASAQISLGPAPGPWILMASSRCVFRDCAEFIQRGTNRIIEQGWISDIPLRGAGELRLRRSGEFTLVRQLADGQEELTFSGPIALYLDPQGNYFVMTPGRGSASHEGDTPSTLPHGLPPLIAGTEGTRFEYIQTLNGATLLRVMDGVVVVKMNEVNGVLTQRVSAGQAILVDHHLLEGSFLRHLTWEKAESLWTALIMELNARDFSVTDPEVYLERFERTAERFSTGAIKGDPGRLALFHTYMELMVIGDIEMVATAAQTLAGVLTEDTLRDHLIFVSLVKAVARGDKVRLERILSLVDREVLMARWSVPLAHLPEVAEIISPEFYREEIEPPIDPTQINNPLEFERLSR